ncbi:glycosyltransferase family 2 protein [Candidatus Margulisiibacteriota bacterium]
MSGLLKDLKILVIIPAYNEEAALPGVIAKIRQRLPQADVLVVNDGSVDATAELARRQGAYVLNLAFNLGIGVAMQAGYQFAQKNGYDIAVQVDADGQHDPAEVHKLIAPLLSGDQADIVVGSRFLTASGFKSTFFRQTGIAIFARLLAMFFGKEITDATSGFRAADRRAIELFSQDYPTDYPEVEALALAHRHKLMIKEVPVAMGPRLGGRSSITPLRSVYYMIKVPLALFIAWLQGGKHE